MPLLAQPLAVVGMPQQGTKEAGSSHIRRRHTLIYPLISQPVHV